MFTPIPTSSASKEKLVNENFLFQQAFNRGVIDRKSVNPPLDPNSEGVYIPAATATGAWTGKENQLLWWNRDGYWRAIAPNEGMKLFSQAAGEIAVEYTAASGWNAIAFTEGGSNSSSFYIDNNYAINNSSQIR